MQAIFHPDIIDLDLPVMRKALRKRGIILDFDAVWKSFQQVVVAKIDERKAAAWETGPEDESRIFRLILPFSELRMNVYLQLKPKAKPDKILVWVLEVGGRMDVPHHLEKRNNVTVKEATFVYPVGKLVPK